MQMLIGVKSVREVGCTSGATNCSGVNLNVISPVNSHSKESILINVPVEDSRLPVLFLTNICHISNKLDDFSVVINRLKLTVICLTETWLNTTIPDVAIDVYGYHVFRKSRSTVVVV